MSIGWTLLGTFGQLMLAVLLFMLVAFSAGGLVSGSQFGRAYTRVLDLSLLVLPGACVLSAVIVFCLQWVGGSARSYWWYLLPLIGTVLYFAYFGALVRLQRRSRQGAGNGRGRG